MPNKKKSNLNYSQYSNNRKNLTSNELSLIKKKELKKMLKGLSFQKILKGEKVLRDDGGGPVIEEDVSGRICLLREARQLRRRRD